MRIFLPVLLSLATVAEAAELEIATFSADVTPPVGHQLFTGGGKDSAAVEDPLFARGFVLRGGTLEKPVVFVSVDWSEIRNDAYDRWRDVLAEAAGTDRVRVMVTSIHQHDTPLADLAAQKILAEAGAETVLVDPDFHEKSVQSVAAAVKTALRNPKPVTQIGIGEGEVKDVASNRRFVDKQGKVSYARGSGGSNLPGRIAPVGTIDPMLKMLSFGDENRAVCSLSSYATHPMSYYRTARISADFPGMARRARQEKFPEVFQIYASGASGNVTVGKFNNGKPEMRPVFAQRLEDGMAAAWKNTDWIPAGEVTFRSEPLVLDPRIDGHFAPVKLRERVKQGELGRMKVGMAALGLSWQARCAAGQPIDVPMLDFGGKAKLILLPAEIYVEYQLFARELDPDAFVMVVGYGECGPGYIPVQRALDERDSNLGDWNWVAPGAEEKVHTVLRKLLAK
ncbi:MAG: hypothetical protein HKN23_07330 [Verrucomicrobiales bacterium]|nr:hypothetical protein [Verrucomicrobiales bacterium]